MPVRIIYKKHDCFSMHLRAAFDSFAVRFTFILSECLFTCLYYALPFWKYF